MKKVAVFVCTIAVAGWLGVGSARAAEAEKEVAPVTVKGEVLDMGCYLDHGAQGAKHAKCAEKCMRSGLPLGIKAEDGTTYLVIGDHKPLNDKLAPYAGKVVTLRGKATERDGIHMLENAEIVQ